MADSPRFAEGLRAPSPVRLSELLTISGETDHKGRLLLEDSAPKGARKRAEREGVAMKSVASTFKDTPSRVGGLLNISAYEALRQDTADILDGFAWLTGRYLALEPARKSTVRLLFDVSYLGNSLPLVLFNRARQPVARHGELPPYVASIFKASRGLLSGTIELLNERGPAATVTAAEVVAFAEEHRHFVRAETGRVCAAPTRLIERTIHVILTGEGGDADASTLEELVDFDTLYQFYGLQDTLGQTLSGYRTAFDTVKEEARSADPGELATRMVSVGGRQWFFGDLTDTTLRVVNDIQERLNRLLGRRGGAPPVDFRALVQLL